MPSKKTSETGQMFRWIRQRDGRKQVEIAREVSITPAYLSMIESGARIPPPDLVKRLAKAYGVPRALLEGLMPIPNDCAPDPVTGERGAA